MPLTTEEIAKRLRSRAETVLAEETDIRKELAGGLLGRVVVTPMDVERLLKAQALAALWRKVVTALDRGRDAQELIREMRADLTDRLLEGPDSTSTSTIANEARRLEAKAAARFLQQTLLFA